MKIGMRKPSLKKSISARTKGKAKRAVKKAIIPGYGKKGAGWIKSQRKLPTTRYTTRHPSVSLICSNDDWGMILHNNS